MCRVFAPLVVALLIAFGAAELVVAADQPQRVTFARSGFAIDVLDPGPAASGGYESLRMLLPPQDGFASNVNIQHQAFSGTLNEYATLSAAGAKQANFTVLYSKIENDAYVAEATGKVGNLNIELHFYFKAIKSGNNAILATATIPAARWEKEKGLLVPIVESLVAVQQ